MSPKSNPQKQERHPKQERIDFSTDKIEPDEKPTKSSTYKKIENDKDDFDVLFERLKPTLLNNGWTPLTYALFFYAEKNKSIELLIKRGADVNKANKDGLTPLMIALKNKSSYEIIELLINKGVDVNAVDKDGWTPLMYALYHNSSDSIIRLLIKHKGANVNTANKDGLTPFMIALKNKYNSLIIKLLIRYGANVNAVDNDGLTPLMIALKNKYSDIIIELFIKIIDKPNFYRRPAGERADVNAVDKDGWTPLMYALYHNSSDTTIQLLIDNGAYINKDLTPSMIATQYNESGDIIKLLRKYAFLKTLENKDSRSKTMFDNYLQQYQNTYELLQFAVYNIDKKDADTIFHKFFLDLELSHIDAEVTYRRPEVTSRRRVKLSPIKNGTRKINLDYFTQLKKLFKDMPQTKELLLSKYTYTSPSRIGKITPTRPSDSPPDIGKIIPTPPHTRPSYSPPDIGQIIPTLPPPLQAEEPPHPYPHPARPSDSPPATGKINDRPDRPGRKYTSVKSPKNGGRRTRKRKPVRRYKKHL